MIDSAGHALFPREVKHLIYHWSADADAIAAVYNNVADAVESFNLSLVMSKEIFAYGVERGS